MLDGGQWWWVVVTVVGGLLAAAYVFKVLRQAFLPAEAGDLVHRLPRTMEWSGFTVGGVLLGLFGAQPLAWLTGGLGAY